MTFTENMDVPWYRALTHLIMEHDLNHARERAIQDEGDIGYIGSRLVGALRTTKTDFSDQSEAFAVRAGKVLINLQNREALLQGN